MKNPVVTFALVACIALGLLVGGASVWHLVTEPRGFPHGPFEWLPFAIAAAMLIVPAWAIQSGDIGRTLKGAADLLPVNQVLERLGRRKSDAVVAVTPSVVVPPVPVIVPPVQHDPGA